jgi:hypothetical protein
MKRWSYAYPGTAKVCYELGRFSSPQAALKAHREQVTILAKAYAEDQAHPTLRSIGYGKTPRYWGEIHFADTVAAETHQKQHGGVLWLGVGLRELKESDYIKSVVAEWLKAHTEATGTGEGIKVDVIENHRNRTLIDQDTPMAYAFVNDPDIAIMLKLSLGGKA